MSWYVPYPEKPTFKLTIRTAGFDGKTVTDDQPFIERDTPVNADTPNDPFSYPQTEFYPEPGADGTWVGTIPAGTYSLLNTHCAATAARRRCAALATSNIEVSGTKEVTLDARKAVRAAARTPEPTLEYDHQLHISSYAVNGFGRSVGIGIPGIRNVEYYATPTAPASKGHVIAQDKYTLGQTTTRARATGGGHTLELRPDLDPYTVTGKLAGDQRIPIVYAGSGKPGDFDNAKGKAALVRLATPADGWTEMYEATDAAREAAGHAAKAGVKVLIPYLDRSGSLPIAPHRPLGTSPARQTPIPMLSIHNADGEKLRTMSPATLETSVKQNPEFIYNLHYSRDNGIPATLTHRVDRRELKKTRSRYHADVPGLNLLHAWTAWHTDAGIGGFRPDAWLHAPAEIDQYTGPPNRNRWWRRSHALTDGKQGAFWQEDITPYRGRREDWFGGPLTMVTAEDSPWDQLGAFARWGPDLFLSSPWLGDSTHGHQSNWPYSFTYRMLRDGNEIPPVDIGVDSPAFSLSAEPGTYRLEGRFVLPDSGPLSKQIRRMSPRVDNVWTFRSRRPPADHTCWENGKCMFQPLLQLRHDHGTDLRNQVKAGRPHRLRITAKPPQGADGAGKVAGLKLSYSTDAGKTWRKARVVGSHGRYVALVKHPDTAGAVWLRTEAWDSNGNRIQQTIQNAYEVTR